MFHSSVLQHAVLLGRGSWMRFNTRPYRTLPPCPIDSRILGELTLSHDATTGVAAYAVDPAAPNGAFHLLHDSTTGLALSDEPQLVTVNLMSSNISPVLAGQNFVDILPQPDICSGQKHLVASGRRVLPSTSVPDLQTGDLVGVTDA